MTTPLQGTVALRQEMTAQRVRVRAGEQTW
jgi:hypothetical protein